MCSPVASKRWILARCPPLDQNLDLAVRQRQELQHGGDGADAEHVAGAGIVVVAVTFGDDENLLVAASGRLYGADRALGADEQRVDAVRKHHHVAQRQDGEAG